MAYIRGLNSFTAQMATSSLFIRCCVAAGKLPSSATLSVFHCSNLATMITALLILILQAVNAKRHVVWLGRLTSYVAMIQLYAYLASAWAICSIVVSPDHAFAAFACFGTIMMLSHAAAVVFWLFR